MVDDPLRYHGSCRARVPDANTFDRRRMLHARIWIECLADSYFARKVPVIRRTLECQRGWFDILHYQTDVRMLRNS